MFTSISRISTAIPMRFAAGLSLFCGSIASANILVNPGFEAGTLAPSLQILDFGGATNWTVTTTEAHTGNYSATDQGNKLVAQYFSPVPTSNITNASIWVKNPHALPNGFYLEYSDATSGAGIFGTTGSWQYVDYTSWLAPGKSLVAIGLWGYSSGGTTERTYTDDWQVVLAPEPTTLAVLCFAAPLVRRRRGN